MSEATNDDGDAGVVSGGGRVLVADDDRDTREFVAELLRRRGLRVDEVADGEAAIERAGRGGIDLALIDVLMPRINGLEACRIIKSLPGAGFLPVVLLTMKTDTASRVEGMRVGADDYICKPFDERELITRVTAMLRMKRLHDQVAAAKARLEELSAHDEMTGLFNFRHLNSRLTEEFKRSERYHDPLAALLIDIDGLRTWNDAHGREVGDAIVRDSARAIRAALREIDIVARYGGDEFLVVLPSTHFAGALSAADRVWRDVRSLSWSPPDSAGRVPAVQRVADDGYHRDYATEAPPRSWPRARITLSIGVALFPSRDVRSKDQLLRAAEASLLRSKRDGGDRICVFQHQGYIYSPSTSIPVSSNFGMTPEGASPPQSSNSKAPSNSEIVAARRIGAPAAPTPEPAATNVRAIDARRGPGRRG